MTRLMLRTFRERLRPEVAVTVLAVWGIAWGVWALLPYRTFESSPTYLLMAAVMPEDVWGIIAITIGVLHLVGLWLDDVALSHWASFASVVLWSYITWLFAASNFASLGVPCYAVITALAMWTWGVWWGEVRRGHP